MIIKPITIIIVVVVVVVVVVAVVVSSSLPASLALLEKGECANYFLYVQLCRDGRKETESTHTM